MQDFAQRTGLENSKGSLKRRYLWTDAFALMNFMALLESTEKQEYLDKAKKLIENVHHTLGQFDEKDARQGWISGLKGKEAEENPTINGLRIGKKMLERQPKERFDQRLEWERDGQYYHYHTRWINALLKAGNYLEESSYKKWAADLSFSGENFIEEKGKEIKMYWKMSVDLSRPLVPLRGAHDPLEGLLCALQAREATQFHSKGFEKYIQKLEALCHHSDWSTNDPLGLGGLLLNVIRAAELKDEVELPDSVHPQKILETAEEGLSDYWSTFHAEEPATYRLAFRECGLSLGIRALESHQKFLEEKGIEVGVGVEIWGLADQIESFWLEEENQKEKSFRDHLDINEVSLTSSLLAHSQSKFFCRA